MLKCAIQAREVLKYILSVVDLTEITLDTRTVDSANYIHCVTAVVALDRVYLILCIIVIHYHRSVIHYIFCCLSCPIT